MALKRGKMKNPMTHPELMTSEGKRSMTLQEASDHGVMLTSEVVTAAERLRLHEQAKAAEEKARKARIPKKPVMQAWANAVKLRYSGSRDHMKVEFLKHLDISHEDEANSIALCDIRETLRPYIPNLDALEATALATMLANKESKKAPAPPVQPPKLNLPIQKNKRKRAGPAIAPGEITASTEGQSHPKSRPKKRQRRSKLPPHEQEHKGSQTTETRKRKRKAHPKGESTSPACPSRPANTSTTRGGERKRPRRTARRPVKFDE